MKFTKQLLSATLLLSTGLYAATPAAISQARADAYRVASQLEQLIKEDSVKNAAEISKLEKQLQGYVSSLNQSGNRNIASEISLRSAKIQEAKVHAGVDDITKQAQQIRASTTDDAAKGKLVTLESKIQELEKNLSAQVEALKGALDENQQLQNQVDASKTLQAATAQEVNRLAEELKKVQPAGSTTGAAVQGIQAELDNAHEIIRKLKEENQNLSNEISQLKASALVVQADFRAELEQMNEQLQYAKAVASKEQPQADQKQLADAQATIKKLQDEVSKLKTAPLSGQADLQAELDQTREQLARVQGIINTYNTTTKPKIEKVLNEVKIMKNDVLRKRKVDDFLRDVLLELK